MAEPAEEGGGGAPATVTFIVGLLIVLFLLWWARHGVQQVPMKQGVFLVPSVQMPIVPGAPQISTTTQAQ